MQLNKNSVSARLFRYFYSTEIMPQSLCTFFWALVLAYTLVIPLEILGLLGRIPIYLIDKKGGGFLPKNPFFKTVMTIFTVVILYCLFVCIYPIIHTFHPIEGMHLGASIFLDIVILIFGIFIYTQQTDNSIIPAYIKAKAKGICPRIDWKD